MSKLTILFIASVVITGAPIKGVAKQAVSVEDDACVILLHGLGRTPASMRKMGQVLHSKGFEVINIGYASRSASIEQLAENAISDGLAQCRSKESAQIHFVTHSLGGILLRHYLESNSIEGLQRSVMLAPPNQGSTAADAWRRVPGYRLLNGEAGFQLGTDEKSVPLQLGPVDFDVGIIAGDRTIDPVTSLFLANPDDGKVSVESTKVAGMKDWLLVHHSHAFIMKSDEVIRQTAHYLTFGEFDRPAGDAADPETVQAER